MRVLKDEAFITGLEEARGWGGKWECSKDAIVAQARRHDGLVKAAEAHVVLRFAVGARRDKRSHAVLVPIHSRKHERRFAVLKYAPHRGF